MRSTLQSIRARRGQNEKGFTLIELLVVVVIIGVLIAIAIPLYLNYQKSSHDKATASDVRNAAVVMEQCFADNGSYPTDFGTDGVIEGGTDGKSVSSTTCASGTINISAGSHVTITVDANTPSFTIVGYNTDGHGAAKTYTYDSSKGGVVDGAQVAAPTTTG